MFRSIHFIVFVFCIVGLAVAQKTEREIYEIKIYRLKDKTQEERVDRFLKDAYLPALHRNGIKNVGVFKPLASDTLSGKRIILLVPYPALEKFSQISDALASDKLLATNGKEYVDAEYSASPFLRCESIILKAFTGMTKMKAPAYKVPASERVYELRSYESATEKLYRTKVRMFNDGDEVGLFNRLGFNAVFYGEVLAGSHMPNLMYMTTFESLDSREAHWKAFRDDPAWLKLKAMPEYLNTVSKSEIFLLRPADYSDY